MNAPTSSRSSAGSGESCKRCDNCRGLIRRASSDSRCTGHRPRRAIQWPSNEASSTPRADRPSSHFRVEVRASWNAALSMAVT
ncbi:Uncharacterised protein [Acinetobacter baumannii]|nr:Uncharacterised protein [Acinetobacter baumannii]